MQSKITERGSQIFISYSSNDSIKANELCSYIENRGMACWIAPRDIPYGLTYGRAIDHAFRECGAVIFLLSSSSVKSTQVEQELYLANQEQNSGLKIFPVYLEQVDLEGSFRYVLSSKQSFYWQDLSSLSELIMVLKCESTCIVPQYIEHEGTWFYDKICSCIQRYFEVYNLKYCDAQMSEEILPNISVVGGWLGNDITTISLISGIEMLWKKKNRNTLFIGKSGFGKTTSLFLLMKRMMEKKLSPIIFYVYLPECVYLSGKDRIIRYTYQNYIEQFDTSISFLEFFEYLNSEIGSDVPHVIIMLDGLDEYAEEDWTDIQFELNRLMVDRRVQLLFTSRTTSYKFNLGDTEVQCFYMEHLTETQIDAYLETLQITIDKEDIPYSIISTPLILTLYCKTNMFLQRSHGHVNCYINEVITEADILWNFMEAIAVKFAEKRKNVEEKLKCVFSFRFILPYIAFELNAHNKIKFTLKEFCDYAKVTIESLKSGLISEVFEEYFGYEEIMTFSLREFRGMIDELFCQHTGFISKTATNEYSFSSPIFQDFFASVFLYRQLLLIDRGGERANYFEQVFLNYNTCKYLGMLCQEYENTPRYDGNKYYYPGKSTLIINVLNKYRNRFGKSEYTAVSNILQTMKISRGGDLSGMNLDYLDLRRTTFTNIICSHSNGEDTLATSFDGCLMDKWNFRTLGYCGDSASICYMEKVNALAAADRNRIDIIDLVSGNIFKSFNIDSEFVQAIHLSPDAERIACTGIWGELKEWDVSTGELVTDYHVADKLLGHMEYLNDDKILFVTRNKEICVYNRIEKTHRTICQINIHNFMCDKNNILLLTTRVREIIQYDLNRRAVLAEYKSASINNGYITQALHTRSGSHIIGCCKNGLVIEWKKECAEPERYYELGDDINAAMLSADENVIYCISEREGLVLVDRTTGRITRSKERREGKWTNITADLSHDRLFFSSMDGQVLMYTVSSLETRVLRNKTHNPYLPFLHVAKCSMKNLHQESTVDSATKKYLSLAGVLLDC